MEYKNTLNLPKSSLPMKANLPAKEPKLLERWYAEDLYGKVCEARQNAPLYVLHDGPPYANGHIHIGTALNKVLKDIVVKFKTMTGYRVPYLPGWDCHGLPIELNVIKELGSKARSMTNIEIRAECAAYAERFVSVMKEEFKRLGGLGEWERPYLTMAPSYEATIVNEFQKFLLSDRIYSGNKPVHWCPSCVTALAEAEVEYDDHVSPSIWVAFNVMSDLGEKIPQLAGMTNVHVIIWTTTPWTIPANLAIAFHPTLEYVAFEHEEKIYIVADSLLKDTAQIVNFHSPKIIARFPGHVLEGFSCRHPIYDRESKMVLAEYVSHETGTGCVHTAPGHGQEDFETGLKYGLDIYNPVDDYGKFKADLPVFGGMDVFEANKYVVDYLRNNGSLLAEETIEHSYPHCWRCKNPVIFRATKQWFISMETGNLREKALRAVKDVTWIPSWGQERILNMIEHRPDWCISRQRVWGVPLTIFTCEKCGEILKNKKVSEKIVETVLLHGADAWFTLPDSDFIEDDVSCLRCGHKKFKREKDILDVWFESGVSHKAVLTSENALEWPSSLYLEGSDQHRGWFQSSLLTAVANYGKPPFKMVLTHGFVVDGAGKKMSKSEGNVTAPEHIIEKFGADILRLWVASEDYMEDIRISEEILDRLTEMYRRIRNTCRFMLGNLFDFNPQTDSLPYEKLEEIDQYILHLWGTLLSEAKKNYERFLFHHVIRAIHQFCVTDLSSFFLDVSKDRLYASFHASNERRSAQTVLYIVLKGLVKLIAPILVFSAEEIWSNIPGSKDSVHLELFPESLQEWDRPVLFQKWQDLLKIREMAAIPLEEARRRKVIGHSLDAKLQIIASQKVHDLLSVFSEDTLKQVFIVSGIELIEGQDLDDADMTCQFNVSRSEGEKCERCWRYDESIGTSKEHPTLCRRCVTVIQQLQE